MGLFDGIVNVSTSTTTLNQLNQAFQNAQQAVGYGGLANGIQGGYVYPQQIPNPPIWCNPSDPLDAMAYAMEPRAHKKRKDIAPEGDRCPCHIGPASKIHSFLERLRMEIEAWHGDILERCPA